jgi:polyferredoxin
MHQNKIISKNGLMATGIALLLLALLLFISTLFGNRYQLTQASLSAAISQPDDLLKVEESVRQMQNREYRSLPLFVRDFRQSITRRNEELRNAGSWEQVLYSDYAFQVAKTSSYGWVNTHSFYLLLLIMGLMIGGALLYVLPKYYHVPPGIKNDHLFRNKVTARGWAGIAIGVLLILFYILLYFSPEYIVSWVVLVSPLSRMLSGKEASQWFLYGLLYTVAVLVMGVRMLLKYRGNAYQQFRTGSVMFFQTSFAFIIPEILMALNQPWYDFKNIWPLNYSFFYDYNLNSFTSGASLGWFMLIWGIALIVIGVPVFTYFFGKRWYCSWVCGCGGLAETLGDPFRQLSDKSLRAWKFERWIVHGVLVLVTVMTIVTLINYFSQYKLLGNETRILHRVYGFFIGSIFAGVIGTGFYPLMGNRVWCRFGCPLAAYLGLVQRFKSRFRITTNGGQCISCGNCSTYCEMGIDVRWYAQRGQNIVRSSCVGCGVCSAVCPRGVLKLENAGEKGRFEFHPIK